jgi:hypothetical protein
MAPFVDNPNCPDLSPFGQRRFDLSNNDVLPAMRRLHGLHDLRLARQIHQGFCEYLRLLSVKFERFEKRRLPAIIRMSGVQQIFSDLFTFDNDALSVWQFHLHDVAKLILRRCAIANQAS